MQTKNSPAKLNLFFEILGKRNDGYHEILSLVCPISIYDTISFDPSDDPQLTLQMSGAGDDVSAGSDNLVFKAFEKLRNNYGVKTGGVINLVKRIPSQAGLGGGSSDAATALMLGNDVWNLKLNTDELAKIGAELGSDVPLFLYEKSVICRSRGEAIEPIADIPTLHFVLLKPPIGLSTPEVYKKYSEVKPDKHKSIEPLLAAIQTGEPDQIGPLLFNRLEQAAELIWPEMHKYMQMFAEFDCPAVRMSGSGTTIFALCRNRVHAEQVADSLRKQNSGLVFMVDSVILNCGNKSTDRVMPCFGV